MSHLWFGRSGRSAVFIAAFLAVVFLVYNFTALDRFSALREEYETPVVDEGLLHPGQVGTHTQEDTTQQAPTQTSNTQAATHSSESDTAHISEHITVIPGGANSHGFTMFDHLFLRNGTFYIVTTDPSSFPPINTILGKPLPMGGDVDMEPTDKEMQFLHLSKAEEVLGSHVIKIRDFSVVIYDPDQFLHHFYHWWGEIILGFWRVYSLLATGEKGSVSDLPQPKRFILPWVSNGSWRDKPGIDARLMRAAFPQALIEESGWWNDMIGLNVTVLFDRVMIVNRGAAHRHPYANLWYKMIAGTMSVTPNPRFFEPIRTRLLGSFLGYTPTLSPEGQVIFPPHLETDKPLVTYVSRQGGSRSLKAEDHEALVKTLEGLKDEGICDFKVVSMEKLTLKEQLELAAVTTIMLGVHGNGLTHEMWMPPTEVSTTIEIFFPNGYLFDYEMLARNMGHKHYAIWNNTYASYPPGEYHKGVQEPEGFHGREIPVHGPTVAEIIRKRLRDRFNDNL